MCRRLRMSLTYDYLHSSRGKSVEYFVSDRLSDNGYEKRFVNAVPDGLSALAIPNAEFRKFFETTVMKWFSDSAKHGSRQNCLMQYGKMTARKLAKEMNQLLRKTISYHDYKEDFYHAFLAGILQEQDIWWESNKEHGEGRSDIVVSDIVNGRGSV